MRNVLLIAHRKAYPGNDLPEFGGRNGQIAPKNIRTTIGFVWRERPWRIRDDPRASKPDETGRRVRGSSRAGGEGPRHSCRRSAARGEESRLGKGHHSPAMSWVRSAQDPTISTPCTASCLRDERSRWRCAYSSAHTWLRLGQRKGRGVLDFGAGLAILMPRPASPDMSRPQPPPRGEPRSRFELFPAIDSGVSW